MMTAWQKVEGYCVMGCGETLFLGDGNFITCSWINCPNPTAVSDILSDPETHHLVTFDEAGFTIKHPIRERLNDALLGCELRGTLENLSRPPVRPGVYRVVEADGAYGWETIS